MPGKGFGDLARQPGLCGIRGDIEMDDFSSLMAEDEQGVENLKPGRYDNEHVDGGGVMQVIVQERAPGWGGDLRPPWQISANRSLAHAETELEQLAMDTGCASERVRQAHRADQIANLAAHPRPPQVA